MQCIKNFDITESKLLSGGWDSFGHNDSGGPKRFRISFDTTQYKKQVCLFSWNAVDSDLTRKYLGVGD